MRSSHPRSPIDHPSNGSKSQIFGQLRSLFLFFLVLQLPYTTLRYIVPFVVFNETFYLVTTIVVLLAGAKVVDKATSAT
jgi:hypothetical protein